VDWLDSNVEWLDSLADWLDSRVESAASLADWLDSNVEWLDSLADWLDSRVESIASTRETIESTTDFWQPIADLLGFCVKMELIAVSRRPCWWVIPENLQFSKNKTRVARVPPSPSGEGSGFEDFSERHAQLEPDEIAFERIIRGDLRQPLHLGCKTHLLELLRIR